MRLDDHVFEEVAMALGVEYGQEEELRRRLVPRFRVHGQAIVRPHGVSGVAAPRSVKLLDISVTGVAISDQIMRSSGDRFLLSLPRAGGNTVDVICTVQQCRLTREGDFRIGAQFTGEQETNTRLVAGVAGVTAAHSAEIKTGIDLNYPAVALVVSHGPGGPKHDVIVKEIAKGGFTLITGHAFAAGERILLQFKDPHIRPQAWWCTMTLVRLAGEGEYRIHARNDGAYIPPDHRGKWHRLFDKLRGK